MKNNFTILLSTGFSATNDLLMFQKTIPAMRLTSQNLTSYLDLQELWRKLNQMQTFKFPFEGMKNYFKKQNTQNLLFII